MERENNNNQENPSLLPIKAESPRKNHGGGGGGGGGGNDRLKRDEWSEGAVSCLLEAYETKWVLRNRAKLKGHDWEDVARFVSARANCTKSPKTQTQCKNKIESMKKRYRSESAAAEGSSWPLYPRLDLLLRGSNPPPQPPQAVPIPLSTNPPPLLLLDPPPTSVHPPPPPTTAPTNLGTAPNSHGSNGIDHRVLAKDDGVGGPKLSDHLSDKIGAMDTDSSTPALYSDKDKLRWKKIKMKSEKNKRRKKEEREIADSIRWLAEAVLKSEQARMETMREIERMRVEADAKRGEMDLKRTEIIANTQLEIARLFAGVSKGGIDSSLRIGRS